VAEKLEYAIKENQATDTVQTLANQFQHELTQLTQEITRYFSGQTPPSEKPQTRPSLNADQIAPVLESLFTKLKTEDPAYHDDVLKLQQYLENTHYSVPLVALDAHAQKGEFPAAMIRLIEILHLLSRALNQEEIDSSPLASNIVMRLMIEALKS
jgi:hypothetical protein